MEALALFICPIEFYDLPGPATVNPAHTHTCQPALATEKAHTYWTLSCCLPNCRGVKLYLICTLQHCWGSSAYWLTLLIGLIYCNPVMYVDLRCVCLCIYVCICVLLSLTSTRHCRPGRTPTYYKLFFGVLSIPIKVPICLPAKLHLALWSA